MAAVGILFSVCVLLSQIQPTFLLSQAAIDKIAYDMRVYAEVVENRQNYFDVTHTVHIILGNYEPDPIPCCDWVMYFHSFYLLFPSDFPQTKEKALHNQNVIVKMIQGDLYSVEPMVGFGDIFQGQWRYITLTAKHSSVSKSDFMPNWYISQKTEVPGIWPAILSDTTTLKFVRPFYYAQQWKRYPADRYDPITPRVRHYRLGIPDKGQIPPPKLVIPTPVILRLDKSGSPKFLTIDKKWRIQAGQRAVKSVTQFLSGKKFVCETDIGRKRSKVIILAKGNIGSEREAYKISVDATKEVVKVTGKDNAGLFYGAQSVISLVDSHFGMAISNVEIHDYPRYPYRAFLLDVARNFHSVAEVKKVIEAMSMYKLNKLVLHLTDDEGWRIPVQGIPELTEIGGTRCHDLQETECIISQLGSGPFDDSSGSGVYTEQEYKEILAYAKKHYVQVIPEIDAPGHAHAAIRAMEVRFIRDRDDEYRLIDPLDRSSYMTTQHWFESVMNPCIESTYTFIDRVISRIVKLHRRVQPLRIISIRGDEVPDGAWADSPECNQFLRRFPKYKKLGLKLRFAERVAAMTKRMGLALQTTEDLILNDNDQPFKLKRFNNNILVVARRNIWEQNKAQLAYRLANKDYKVIMSQATHLYLDHPYEPSPTEPGLYWATRFTDTRKVFSFKPDELYDNIDLSRAGKPLTYEEVCGAGGRKCEKLLKKKRKNIIGMQAHLWTETVRDGERLNYMAFPRLLAFAERAWHKGKFEFNYLPSEQRKQMEGSDWVDFANTLGYKELWRLDNMGVKYRIPPPGASVSNGNVSLSVAYPGLVAQYSYDDYNKDPKTWYDADGPFQQYGRTILLRTKSAQGDRFSRVDYLS